MMILRFGFGLLLVSGYSTQILIASIASQPVQTVKNSIILPLLLFNQTKKSDREVATSLKNNAMTSLDDYKWKKRLLLVFAPQEDPAYQKQIQLFKQQVGFEQRDLLIVQLLIEGTSRIDTQPISPVLAAQIRDRFKVEQQDFQVILVGKDGTTKRRDRSLVPPEVIFGEIDAMPMRQQEMRSRSN